MRTLATPKFILLMVKNDPIAAIAPPMVAVATVLASAALVTDAAKPAGAATLI